MKHDHLTILMTTRMITTITGMKVTQGMGMVTTTIQDTDMVTTTTTIPMITAKPVGAACTYRFS